MHQKTYSGYLWIISFYLCCILRPSSTCEVDDGAFFTTITVNEETEIGTVVGSLNFVNPESIAKVEVVDPNPYFDYISSNNSLVVTSRIDMDQGLNPLQLMILECMNTNGPTLEIEVEFELKDVNDFAPTFKPTNQYSASISEAAIIGTQISLVEADDDDIKNAFIIYELQTSEHSSLFKIETAAGGKAAITLNGVLDYESAQVYKLTVLAKDCQSRRNCSVNQKMATAEVTVTVEDADDLSPEFDQSTYTVSIFEDSVLNTVVAQLVARDQDTLNAPIRYSIEGEGDQYFSVDQFTGMVTVGDMAGIVKGNRYLLQAKAWQANDVNKKTTATLIIKIVPTNGNAPQFSKSSYNTALPEGSPIGTQAFSFTVSDRDTTEQLTFSLLNYPAGFPFQLRVTGLNSASLVVSSALDYETTEEYSAVVAVSDGEFRSEADVFISIINDNDHNPEFQNAEPYQFQVKWQDGGVVGRVKAIDKDTPASEPNPVSYTILPPHDRLFRIDDTGEITLSAPMSEYKSTKYLINVQAMDMGKSPRSSTTVVEILLDIPDLVTTAEYSSGDNSNTSKQSKDKLAIYIIAGIAGFLLILVALLVMCFVKRKAKRTAKQLQKKDCEQATFEHPYNTMQSSDTLKSITDSQGTLKTQATLVASEDESLPSIESEAGVASLQSDCERFDRNLQNHEYDEKRGSDEENIAQLHSIPNNLSIFADKEHSCLEVAANSDSHMRNITALGSNPPDSGRSSMKDRSPYVKRIPFQRFLHPKSSSIDETGHYSQDEEIALETFQNRTARGLVGVHSNSFNTGRCRPDISNIRATDTLPDTYASVSQGSMNSAFIAEAPVEFRSETTRAASPHSGTSDYESNSPSPGLPANKNMIDYCTSLPAHLSDVRTRLPAENFWSKKTLPGSLYKSPNNMSVNRSDTPCTDISTETDSIGCEEPIEKPEMTIYF